MANTPRTMTLAGLKFLRELAAQKKEGVYLEIGPLFGSSTHEINLGRDLISSKDMIHTIDTFEEAQWIYDRFGFNLSKEAFIKFTKHIKNLKIYEGYSPAIVKEIWVDKIGFYFDDATHGNPGWKDNYEFFSQFFEPDAIICGDDFASGWPDIVKNIYELKRQNEFNLYVIGRVWAFTFKEDKRIEKAIDNIYPLLKNTNVVVVKKDKEYSNKIACWSYGIHLKELTTSFEIISSDLDISFTAVYKNLDVLKQSKKFGLDGLFVLTLQTKSAIIVQYCLLVNNTTSNTRYFKPNEKFILPENSSIIAIRFGQA